MADDDKLRARWSTTVVAALSAGVLILGIALGLVIESDGEEEPTNAIRLMCSAVDMLDQSFVQQAEQGDIDPIGDPNVAVLMAIPNLAEAEARTGPEPDDALLEDARSLRRSVQRAEFSGLGNRLAVLTQRC